MDKPTSTPRSIDRGYRVSRLRSTGRQSTGARRPAQQYGYVIPLPAMHTIVTLLQRSRRQLTVTCDRDFIHPHALEMQERNEELGNGGWGKAE